MVLTGMDASETVEALKVAGAVTRGVGVAIVPFDELAPAPTTELAADLTELCDERER